MEKAIKWALWLVPWMTLTYQLRFSIGPLPTTVLEVYLLAVLGAWVGWLFSKRQLWATVRASAERSGRWGQLIHAWLLVTLLAVFVSPSWWTGLGLWRAYVLEPVLLSFVAYVQLKDRTDWERLWQSSFGVVVFLAATAIGQFVTGWGIPHPWNVAISAGRRATGIFRYPNALSLYTVPIGALAFASLVSLIRTGAEWKKWVLPGLAVLATAVCLVLAKSEGGMLGLGAAMFLVLLSVRRIRSWVLFGAVSATVTAFLIPSLRTALVREATFQGWSGRVRMWMWQDTWRMLKDHWFFGAGFGGYPKVFVAYHTKKFIEIFQYPHTILFNFWSETGLMGVVVMGSMLVKWVVVGMKQWAKDGLMVLAPLVGIIVQGMVDVPYFKNDLAVMFWLFIVFAMWVGTRPPPSLRDTPSLSQDGG